MSSADHMKVLLLEAKAPLLEQEHITKLREFALLPILLGEMVGDVILAFQEKKKKGYNSEL